MEASLHSYMKVGIVHFMAFPATAGGEGPVLESVRAIAEDPFFQAIEITHVADPAVRRELAALLRTAHMVVGYGAQPVLLRNKLDLNSADAAAREAAVSRIEQAVDEAAELGATRLALLSGKHPGPEGQAAATERLLDSLRRICRRGRERGVGITLETFDYDIDKAALVGPNAEAVEVAKELRRDFPDFGLMLDLSHLPLQRETSEHALRVARDVLVHAHIGNCVLDPKHPLYGDKHPAFGIEGGVNDVPEVVGFLRVLREIGYLRPGAPNVLAFEVAPTGGQGSGEVIAGAKRVLQAAWAQL